MPVFNSIAIFASSSHNCPGDQYMCVANLPDPLEDYATRAVHCALDMIEESQKLRFGDNNVVQWLAM